MAAKPSDIKRLKQYIHKGWEFHVIEMLHALKPVEIAELIEALDEETRGEFFILLDVETASEVIAELSSESRENVLEEISDSDLARIVGDMNSDDAADLVADLHDDRAERVLAAMDPRDSSHIKALLEYPEDTAGGIMQRELVSVLPGATVDEAITQIRQQFSEVDDIHTVFVVDQRRELLGTADLVSLILAKPDTPITQVIDTDPLTVPVAMDQEEVARLFKKYDAVSMPVVDEDNRLLGRITVDDIVDVLEEEATEDMFMLAGAEEDLLSSSVLKNASTRIPWLLVCWVGGVLSAMLIRLFEPTLSQIVGLAAFMPIVLGMGGNVGSQSVALVVRGIATGLTASDRFKGVILKQVGVGMLLGLLYGGMLGALTVFIYPETIKMSFVVGISVFISMSLASFLGTALPVFFYKIGKDPAVASAPLMTTGMDLLGVVSYFAVAIMIMF